MFTLGPDYLNRIWTKTVCGICGTAFDPATTFHVCPTSTALPSVEQKTGWICPVCGRGMAPWKDICDCHPAYTYNVSGGAND